MKFLFLSSSLFCASDVEVAVDALQLHLSADPEPKDRACVALFFKKMGSTRVLK